MPGKSQVGLPLRHRIFWTLLAHTLTGAVAARCPPPRTARRAPAAPEPENHNVRVVSQPFAAESTQP